MLEISEELKNYILENAMYLIAILSLIKLVSFKIDSSIWAIELSEGQTKGNQKGYKIFNVIFYALVLIFFIYADNKLLEYDFRMNQATLWFVNLIIFFVYIVFDLLVIDMIIYTKIQPKFMAIKNVPWQINLIEHAKTAIMVMIFGSVFGFIASILTTI